MRRVKVTLKDLDNVIIEIAEFMGGMNKEDREELRNIIGDFGVEQFNRGYKLGRKDGR